jgi:hypothetical protein
LLQAISPISLSLLVGPISVVLFCCCAFYFIVGPGEKPDYKDKSTAQAVKP